MAKCYLYAKEIEKSLSKIRLGKKDDLHELDEAYWQADYAREHQKKADAMK